MTDGCFTGNLTNPFFQRTTFQVIRQVYKADKLLGFYKGFRLTVIREIPGYFCYFGGYTLTCNLLGVNRETARLSKYIRTFGFFFDF